MKLLIYILLSLFSTASSESSTTVYSNSSTVAVTSNETSTTDLYLLLNSTDPTETTSTAVEAVTDASWIGVKAMNEKFMNNFNKRRREYAKGYNIANMNKLYFNHSLLQDTSRLGCKASTENRPGLRLVYLHRIHKTNEAQQNMEMSIFTKLKKISEGTLLGDLEYLWPTNTQFACSVGHAQCGTFCSFAPGGVWGYDDIDIGKPGSACGGEVENGLCLPTTNKRKKPLPVEKGGEEKEADYDGETPVSGDDEYYWDDPEVKSPSRRLTAIASSMFTLCFVLCI